VPKILSSRAGATSMNLRLDHILHRLVYPIPGHKVASLIISFIPFQMKALLHLSIGLISQARITIRQHMVDGKGEGKDQPTTPKRKHANFPACEGDAANLACAAS
jgi:hypothetical protein